LIQYLREQLKPKDLKVVPERYFHQPGMLDFQEWSTIRRWMMQWLKAVQWYSTTALEPVVSIQALIDDAPVVQTNWNLSRKDESLFRFGLIWKCFDTVNRLGVDYLPGLLPVGGCQFYLYGGYQGTSFLVSAWGLEQPHAGKGVVAHTRGGQRPNRTIRYKKVLYKGFWERIAAEIKAKAEAEAEGLVDVYHLFRWYSALQKRVPKEGNDYTPLIDFFLSELEREGTESSLFKSVLSEVIKKRK
jgi:hypothetical protein